MHYRLIARGLGAARIAFGVALIAAPERLAKPWLGQAATRPGTQVAVRGLGARDAALGAGALLGTEGALPLWLAGGIAGDAADLVATVAGGRALPLRGRALVGAFASFGVAVGAAALASLRGGPPAAS